jgi:hypothetical protein
VIPYPLRLCLIQIPTWSHKLRLSSLHLPVLHTNTSLLLLVVRRSPVAVLPPVSASQHTSLLPRKRDNSKSTFGTHAAASHTGSALSDKDSDNVQEVAEDSQPSHEQEEEEDDEEVVVGVY